MTEEEAEEALREIFGSPVCHTCGVIVESGEHYCSEDCKRYSERFEKYSEPPEGYEPKYI